MNVQYIKNGNILDRIKEVIMKVEEPQNLQNISNIKKLKGGNIYFRVRVGEYLGLTIDKNIVTFVRCLNRKEIYRYFP